MNIPELNNTQDPAEVIMCINIRDWLDSFGDNNNTGVEDEKKVGISILTGSQLDTLENVPESYRNIRSHTMFNVVGIQNLTQRDGSGGTGDIGIVYNNGSVEYFSITKRTGNQLTDKKLDKCIRNPTGRHYGLSKTPEMEQRNKKSYDMAVEHRKNNYGSSPSPRWKRVMDCPGSKHMCEYLASEASSSWNKLNVLERKKKLQFMLDLDTNNKPTATGIIYWNDTHECIKKIYTWTLDIDLSEYLETYIDGIYVCHGRPGDYIIKVQAKYNNGIIEGMPSRKDCSQWKIKSSTNYFSSWNAVTKGIKKIFTMSEKIL
jgi:hypothetical protein